MYCEISVNSTPMNEGFLLHIAAYHDWNPCCVKYREDNVGLPAQVSDGRWGNIDNKEIANPVHRGRDRRASLAELEWQNLGWVNPDGGLEADGKGALEDEEHGSGANTRGIYA